MRFVPPSLGGEYYTFRGDLAVGDKVQSGGGWARGDHQNHSYEAVTADFASDQHSSPPNNSLHPPNQSHPSNVSAVEELVTLYISAVMNLNVKVGKRDIDKLLAIVYNPNFLFSEMANIGSS